MLNALTFLTNVDREEIDGALGLGVNYHSQYFNITLNGECSLKEEYLPEGDKEFDLPNNLAIPNSIVYVANERNVCKDGLIQSEKLEEIIVVKSLQEGMFANNVNINSLTLPDSITILPKNFCNGALNLKTIKNTNNIKEIKDNAFKNSGLKKALFPNVSILGESCFETNTSLTFVNLNNIFIFPKKTFYNCLELQTVQAEKCIEIKESAFELTPQLININFSPQILEDHAFWNSRITGQEENFSQLKEENIGENSIAYSINGNWSASPKQSLFISGGVSNSIPVWECQRNSTKFTNKYLDKNEQYSIFDYGGLVISLFHAYCGNFYNKNKSIENFIEELKKLNVNLIDSSEENLNKIFQYLGFDDVNYYSFSNDNSNNFLDDNFYECLKNGGYCLIFRQSNPILAYGFDDNGNILYVDSEKRYFNDDKAYFGALPLYNLINKEQDWFIAIPSTYYTSIQFTNNYYWNTEDFDFYVDATIKNSDFFDIYFYDQFYYEDNGKFIITNDNSEIEIYIKDNLVATSNYGEDIYLIQGIPKNSISLKFQGYRNNKNGESVYDEIDINLDLISSTTASCSIYPFWVEEEQKVKFEIKNIYDCLNVDQYVEEKQTVDLYFKNIYEWTEKALQFYKDDKKTKLAQYFKMPNENKYIIKNIPKNASTLYLVYDNGTPKTITINLDLDMCAKLPLAYQIELLEEDGEIVSGTTSLIQPSQLPLRKTYFYTIDFNSNQEVFMVRIPKEISTINLVEQYEHINANAVLNEMRYNTYSIELNPEKKQNLGYWLGVDDETEDERLKINTYSLCPSYISPNYISLKKNVDYIVYFSPAYYDEQDKIILKREKKDNQSYKKLSFSIDNNLGFENMNMDIYQQEWISAQRVLEDGTETQEEVLNKPTQTLCLNANNKNGTIYLWKDDELTSEIYAIDNNNEYVGSKFSAKIAVEDWKVTKKTESFNELRYLGESKQFEVDILKNHEYVYYWTANQAGYLTLDFKLNGNEDEKDKIPENANAYVKIWSNGIQVGEINSKSGSSQTIETIAKNGEYAFVCGVNDISEEESAVIFTFSFHAKLARQQ